jgi:hypothetical protein
LDRNPLEINLLAVWEEQGLARRTWKAHVVPEGGAMSAGTVMYGEATAAALLALEREERSLSQLRHRLHERIDNGFPNELLVVREREVSRKRRELHSRIDGLRATLRRSA